MPRGCKPTGEQALSNAERQARHRARLVTQSTTTPAATIVQTRKPADRRSRPQRWRDAVNELLALQAGYADWLTAIPDGLRESRMAEALAAIVDLDLTALTECEPPRGYGRD